MNFVASDRIDAVTDNCSHGTMTLGLLLRVAPDADIYVAKVADDLQFEDTTAVANVSRLIQHTMLSSS